MVSDIKGRIQGDAEESAEERRWN